MGQIMEAEMVGTIGFTMFEKFEVDKEYDLRCNRNIREYLYQRGKIKYECTN